MTYQYRGTRSVVLCTECHRLHKVGDTINPENLCAKCKAAWYSKFPKEKSCKTTQ